MTFETKNINVASKNPGQQAMLYYSTNRGTRRADPATALQMGLAGDKGLFMPNAIPRIKKSFLQKAKDLSYPELAANLISPYFTGTFTYEQLMEICADAYNFDIPLEHVSGKHYIMRLDQGPTASFKDFAARFMGRSLGRLVQQKNGELVILTATSGDTGSAVANAFLGVEGIRVLVLFPEKEVSDRQRKQMTTLGNNISAISVDGKFDHCQALVKQAFADPQLEDLKLSSANSINIGRLIPQSVYYVYAAARLADVASGEKVIFSIPSGNFGNMMGGMLSYHGGLPVAKFVIGVNSNDEFPRFVQSGDYEPVVPSRECISNAMNVGHPSNLARLVDLYGGQMTHTGDIIKMPDMDMMRKDIFSTSISDDKTRETIRGAYNETSTLLEPHGAVGWAALNQYLETGEAGDDITTISLETAHPAKFPEEVKKAVGIDPAVPPSLEGLEARRESFDTLGVDYEGFKNYLEKEYRK